MDAGGRVKKQSQLTYEDQGIPLALIVLSADGMWAAFDLAAPATRVRSENGDV